MIKYDRRSLIVFVVIALIALGFLFKNQPSITKNFLTPAPTPTPTPEPPFTTYNPPKIADAHIYTVLLVGDSMTHALGPYGGRLTEWLHAKFKGKGFFVINYAYGTNVLSLPNFLNKETKTWDLTFPPILSRDYNVLIIESFGYNPLSDHPTEEGLKLQSAMLDQTMKTLIRAKPNSLVVFMATIAPNLTHYGQNTISLTQEGRTREVNERVAYIKNHIAYAQSHNIPLINVYEKSLTPAGDGNLQYINSDDYIHPSSDGIELISSIITNYLYDQNLLPH